MAAFTASNSKELHIPMARAAAERQYQGLWSTISRRRRANDEKEKFVGIPQGLPDDVIRSLPKLDFAPVQE